MADVQTGGDGGGKGKHGKKRAKKASTRIDMTPMVDLAFLLLTFFVLTSTFSKPTTMEIIMPVKDDNDTAKIKVKKVVTFLLAENDKIYYYQGVLDSTVAMNETSYDDTKGVRKILLDLQKPYIEEFKKIETEVQKLRGQISDDSIKKLYNDRVNEVHKRKEKDPGGATWTVIIKPDNKASYRNVIDMVDEMSIAQIGKYAIVDISPTEKGLIKNK